MKVKIISRSADEYTRETNRDIERVQRNYDPSLHPFAFEREYRRALNAVKLDKIFAKPFVGALSGHEESVQCMLKHPTSISTLVSGACDGQIKLWNLVERKCVRTVDAHESIVRSLFAPQHGRYFFSVGDNSIKQWRLSTSNRSSSDELESAASTSSGKSKSKRQDAQDFSTPINTILSKHVLMQGDHHRDKPLMVTCGEVCELWEETRSTALATFKWGADSVSNVKFNAVETDLFVSSMSDRGLVLYDIRQSQPLKKIVLKMKTNAICWNPMEAFVFTAANEDHDLHTFDMRNLAQPLVIHKDHVSAVLDVDYSPTGREFVSGGYDRTLRIFSVSASRSREVYHTKRMQRLNSVVWTADAKYVISGSNEFDIRVWKAHASEKLGVHMQREQSAFQYQDKLKQKYSEYPEIKRIANHRHVPKHVYSQRREKQGIVASQKRKERNIRAHTRPEKQKPYQDERAKLLVKEEQ
jgi:WD repeat and SOF domain-containing protein 1